MAQPHQSFKNMKAALIQNKLKLAIFLTSLVMVAEAVGGILAHSLSLLGDAAHMLTDVFSLSLSWFALKIADKPVTATKTYGYHRMEIFAALTNGILLFIMALWILWEAIERFQSPLPVHTPTVMVVALLGLITNLAVMYFLKDSVGHGHHHDLNLKGAFYHVIGDTLASVAVLLGGLVMWYTQWYVLDVVIAALISLILMWGARSIIADSFHILLEGVPRGISLKEVERELTAIPAVEDIHELHVWCICSNIYALSTHALVNNSKVSQVEDTLKEIKALLKDRFNITHSTIQFEFSPCSVSDALCDMKH
ncbi:cobalt-zinc-cadmium efflux system protein [Nitrospina gracilis]|nr:MULTISPECIES: cation diffusion facilitator family transporter [Nitrospina]MCF8724805.1 cobalt-zinc-cadmium efflux system protein [Nitrospina sp. Nb-3]